MLDSGILLNWKNPRSNSCTGNQPPKHCYPISSAAHTSSRYLNIPVLSKKSITLEMAKANDAKNSFWVEQPSTVTKESKIHEEIYKEFDK